MSTWLGNQGTVKVDTDGGGSTVAVGELKSWTLSVTQSAVETTSRGDSWRTRTAGLKDCSGTITCHFDKANAEQNIITVGSTLELELNFDDGTDKFTGDVLIVSENFSADINDQVTEAQYAWVNVDNTGVNQTA